MGETIFTIFDIINLALVVFLCGLTIKKYMILPNRIPIHFDFEGKPDNYGNKNFAFLFPIMGLIFYGGFYFISSSPDLVNYSVAITETNKDKQFFIGILFMKWMLLIVLLLFINIQDYMFRYSFNEKTRLRVPIWAPLVLIFFSVAAFIIISSINK
ncbi:putative membrane protein [Chryseobacterium sp. H1D6B]|uniref:DUF1648 domain-containing protein n=1 Tax=Chryseobacterium sp. H1D6B TaxID=2940588 RepID=UPI0015CE8020|nr:DUF1648 domain-containing protein [Chryseobacterium sp. H1D6B]MDH6251179.1 putative membrane protein [Chryseobacterium sp. H1D6B]